MKTGLWYHLSANELYHVIFLRKMKFFKAQHEIWLCNKRGILAVTSERNFKKRYRNLLTYIGPL